MNTTLLLLTLLPSVVLAEQFEFRGDYVTTYTTDAGYTKTLPEGTKLACNKDIVRTIKRGAKVFTKNMSIRDCTSSGMARIYVFKDEDGEEMWFWTAHVNDVLYNTKEDVLHWLSGPNYRIVYDDTNQIIEMVSATFESELEMARKLEKSVPPTYRQLVEMTNANEAAHQKKLDERLKKETEKYWKGFPADQRPKEVTK